MGTASGSYGTYHVVLALLWLIGTAMAMFIYFAQSKYCIYKCPLATLDATFMNQKVAENDTVVVEFLGAGNQYLIDETTVTGKTCTSGDNVAFCLKKPSDASQEDGKYTFLNTCQSAESVKSLSIGEAWNLKCLYCDEAGTVLWPSLTTSAQIQWLEARQCGESVTNGGINPKDIPQLLFGEMKNDLGETYAYGQGEKTICFDIDPLKKEADTVVGLMLLLLLYNLFCFLLSLIAGLIFFKFAGFYRSDWHKLNRCDNCCGCCAKLSQKGLRILWVIGVLFVLYEWYLIVIIGVCNNALDDVGMPTFYSTASLWSWFSLFVVIFVCVVGNCFRRVVPIETPFYAAHVVLREDEHEGGLGKFKRVCWSPFCVAFDEFVGP
eukprot:g5444.t1